MTLFFCFLGLVVRGQEQDKYVYIKPLFDFDVKKPLFVLNKDQLINENRYLRYYALTGYREGVATTSGPFGLSFSGVNNTISGTRLLYMYNVSIGEIVTHRLGESDRVIYEVNDPSRYRYLPKYGPRVQWLRKNGLCFEVMFPSSSINIKLVDTLLSKSLGITWNREKRRIPVVILSRLSKEDKNKFKFNAKSNGDAQGSFSGVTFDALGSALAVDGRPFLNETNYEGLVNLNIEVKDPRELSSINKQLRRYDLVVKEEIRELDMLVVRELKFEEK